MHLWEMYLDIDLTEIDRPDGFSKYSQRAKSINTISVRRGLEGVRGGQRGVRGMHLIKE